MNSSGHEIIGYGQFFSLVNTEIFGRDRACLDVTDAFASATPMPAVNMFCTHPAYGKQLVPALQARLARKRRIPTIRTTSPAARETGNQKKVSLKTRFSTDRASTAAPPMPAFFASSSPA